MRKPLFYKMIAVVATIMAASLLASAQGRERTTGPKSAEHEVRAVIANWARAVKNHDVPALSSMFADDLFITDYNGATRGKKEELEILKPSPTNQIVSVANENIVVRTFPKSNVAVVTARVRMVFRASGRDTPMAMRYTSVWEKRGGRWRLTILQTARTGK